MAINLNNTGQAQGRLVKDPQMFTNRDGSLTVYFTLAIERNYRNQQGAVDTDYIPFKAFVSSDRAGTSFYGNLEKGDMVRVEYTVRVENYIRKDGTQVYNTILHVNQIQWAESKAAKEERKKRAAAPQASAPTQPAPQQEAPVQEKPKPKDQPVKEEAQSTQASAKDANPLDGMDLFDALPDIPVVDDPSNAPF